MSWTKDNQARLDRLRAKELDGTLSGTEQAELAALMAQVEAEEAQVLAPAMNRLRGEMGEFDDVQSENEEVARLLAQQQALAADARRFFAEFEQRRASILRGLARCAGGTLPPT
jgi:hypothetical protein